MPKTAKELSAIQVKRLTAPGRHPVGGVRGLLLQVRPSGARSWLLRTTIGGNRRDVGLGSFPDVPLAQARERAREIQAAAWEGRDPVSERRDAQAALAARQAKAISFDAAAKQYLEAKRAEFSNPKHAAQWEATLRTYASPVIGGLPVDQVELAHVVKVLEPIWQAKTETATRLRGRIEKVLAWATVRGLRSGDNPARWRGNLDAVLPAPNKLKGDRHFTALPFADVPAFMAKLAQRDGTAARALEFTILTAARSGEVRGATWQEVDLDAGTWTIPAERMKAGQPHRVPLSPAALAVLQALPQGEPGDLIFPAPRGGTLSDMSLSAVLKRMEVPATVHGFRSSFRDWAAERTAYANEVIEKSMAHTITDKVERAYRRGDLFDKRRRLMADWAAHCAGQAPAGSGDVVAIGQAG